MGGLSLAIAQRIGMLHGGRLHTLPAPQGGTTLRPALPLQCHRRSRGPAGTRSRAGRSGFKWRQEGSI